MCGEETQVGFLFLAGDFSPALFLTEPGPGVQQAWLCSATFSSTPYVIKTMTQLEVKVLFNKYNFHKPFSKQQLTKLYKEQAHGLAGRGAKIT